MLNCYEIKKMLGLWIKDIVAHSTCDPSSLFSDYNAIISACVYISWYVLSKGLETQYYYLFLLKFLLNRKVDSLRPIALSAR